MLVQYLITGTFIDNPAASEKEVVEVWYKLIHPSHEILERMVEDKKIIGGCFAGQRAIVFILDTTSHEEVGGILASLPFWARLKWDVLPIQSFRSGDERDRKVIDKLRKDH